MVREGGVVGKEEDRRIVKVLGVSCTYQIKDTKFK